MRVRPATDEDNPKLIAIEGLTPQGSQIQLASERTDYFFRAKKFEEPIFLVAEDEAEGDILGVMGVGPVTVRLGGEQIRAGLVFDWRSNPLAQKGLPRHMLRIWQAMQKEIAQRDLKFIFGYVKEDNERSKAVLTKYGAQVTEAKEFLTMPVHASFSKNKAGVDRVSFVATIDEKKEEITLKNHFENLDLFPVRSGSPLLAEQRKRYTFGKFVYGKSEVKVWDTNAEYTQRVLNMPLIFKIARPLVKAGSKVFSVPHIPKIGDQIKTWQLYDLILDQLDDLDYLLERIRLAAQENGVHYLVFCMNEKDSGYAQINKKAWIRPKYYLFFQPLSDLPFPQAPSYFDVSYL